MISLMATQDKKETKKSKKAIAEEKGALEEKIASALLDDASDDGVLAQSLNALRALGATRLSWESHIDETLLIVAAKRGKNEAIRLLAEWPGVDGCDLDGESALMWCARLGNAEGVALLAERADVNMFNGSGYAAIHLAAMNNFLDVVRLCVELSGGDGLPLTEGFGDSALQVAIEHNSPECAMFLMRHCDLASENTGAETALSMAIRNDRVEIAKLLAPVSTLGSRITKNFASSLVAYAAQSSAAGCLGMFLAETKWDRPQEVDILEVCLRIRNRGGRGDAMEEKANKCLALVERAIPPGLGREMLEKHGSAALPQLSARIEAADLAQAVAGGNEGASASPEAAAFANGRLTRLAPHKKRL